jgi:aldehyde dehydrogenase (NAD+)
MSWRVSQLRALGRLLEDEAESICTALVDDLGKPEAEAWITEIATAKGEVDALRNGLKKWSRPERVRIPLILRPGSARVLREPLGVVLVISPWNYPVNLVVAPLAAAIASGNCVVVKPSELAPATSKLFARILPHYLDGQAIAVVEGAGAEVQELIHLGVDHVFFTGSATVGRLVMEAAARHLTPVTLELGGKSPAIVGEGADVRIAARRVAWGKFLNAGQTCLAPDYVLVHRSQLDDFVSAVIHAIDEFYGREPSESADYGRILNATHIERLKALLSDHGGTLQCGGRVDEDERYIAPTVITNVSSSARMMTEEIFGPILPVISFVDLDEATAFIEARPTPLSLYVFAKTKREARQIIGSIRSGSVCVNATLLHFADPQLPFGGLGESGIGAYHGRAGFEAFSHRRAVLYKRNRPDIPLAYPPYRSSRMFLLRRLL